MVFKITLLFYITAANGLYMDIQPRTILYGRSWTDSPVYGRQMSHMNDESYTEDHFTDKSPNFGTLAELRTCARSLGVKVIKYSTGMKELSKEKRGTMI